MAHIAAALRAVATAITPEATAEASPTVRIMVIIRRATPVLIVVQQTVRAAHLEVLSALAAVHTVVEPVAHIAAAEAVHAVAADKA